MGMSMYGKLCTQTYDLDKPGVSANAIEFFSRHLEGSNGPVLEPMCGSGSFLIPFLERGIGIEGVDASPHMLQACRDKAAAKGLSPVLHGQYLHELSLPRRFGFMFIPFGSFGLIADKKEASASLQRLYDHLLPGGKLVLQIDTTRAQPQLEGTGSWGGRWGGGWVTRPDGAKIVLSVLSRQNDPDEQIHRQIMRYELFENGRLVDTELEDFAVRYYERDQLQRLLAAAGFVDIRTARSYDDTEPSDEDDTVVIDCIRPGA